QKNTDHLLAESVAPHNRYFGVMLPYTPLHYLLLEKDFPALVMTSANLTDEPIAYEDEEACHRLAEIADVFLSHNRRIFTRTDDSIARVMADRPLLLRRSRGYVPRAVPLSKEMKPVLAVGAELKNTICLTRGDRAFLSQHIGDLKNLQVYESFRQAIGQLKSILEVEPTVVAHDLHPDYYSSHYALEESGMQPVAVQHHHAHLASCLAENGVDAPAIGMIFDGTGYGTDGHIWGGEFLVGDVGHNERVGHFRYQPMPGGDLAIKQPWRMAMSYMQSIYGEVPEEHVAFKGVAANERCLVSQAIKKSINSPLTSSCGRLFDAVAALVGLRQVVTFEGQAAMQLEMIADPQQSISYPCSLYEEDGLIIYDPTAMIMAIQKDFDAGSQIPEIAGRFHYSMAMMVTEVCLRLRKSTSLNRVVLSGGVFQNCLLTELCVAHLENAGF
ncbi:MAG: carbamoyltransferase HypF, partial [Gammaproteobacteria bacterium]|nr:carbamoyltransferase HypF [Gammaproteobacteria bacterium]NIR92180.1 carbamoyltransferase HypF [Gammaproteobacteria bacterium]